MARDAMQRNSDADILKDPSDLEDLLGYNLKRAYILSQNDYRAGLDGDGPSPRVFAALSMTVKFPNITQIELARMLGIERSGLVAIVDELEAKSYLQRAPVPGDRRVQALVPTAEGVNAYRKAIASVRAREDAFFTDLNADEKIQLLGLLRKIRQKEAQT